MEACCPACRGARALVARPARRRAWAPTPMRYCATCSASHRESLRRCAPRGHLGDQAAEEAMSISLNQANRVLRATVKKAEELNIKVSAAVVDAGGRLVAFQRMDGAIWGSAYGRQGKAVGSEALGGPSGGVAGR